MDALTGPVTVTLPTAVGNIGRELVIKKIDSSSNEVTVGTTASQTIDGASSLNLILRYNFVSVVSDGSNWNVIGRQIASLQSVTYLTPGSYSWAVPSGITSVNVTVVAGGGGGGGSGGYVTQTVSVTGSVGITVGASGTGGLHCSGSNCNGTAGSAGTSSSFGAVTATGGGAGAGGINGATVATLGGTGGSPGGTTGGTGSFNNSGSCNGTIVGGGSGGGNALGSGGNGANGMVVIEYYQ